jgi:hypothetical protein
MGKEDRKQKFGEETFSKIAVPIAEKGVWGNRMNLKEKSCGDWTWMGLTQGRV